jgi:hypothetical protein
LRIRHPHDVIERFYHAFKHRFTLVAWADREMRNGFLKMGFEYIGN